jgi:hypothetical protein
MRSFNTKGMWVLLAATAVMRLAHAEDVCGGLTQVAPGAQPNSLDCVDASAKTAYNNSLNTISKFVASTNDLKTNQANTDQQTSQQKTSQIGPTQYASGGDVSVGPTSVGNSTIGGGAFSRTTTGNATLAQNVVTYGSNTGTIDVNGVANTGGTVNTGTMFGNAGLAGGSVQQSAGGNSSGQSSQQQKTSSQGNAAPAHIVTK